MEKFYPITFYPTKEEDLKRLLKIAQDMKIEAIREEPFNEDEEE